MVATPGWYADPSGEHAWRWWDGRQWTGWTSPPTSGAVVPVLPAHASRRRPAAMAPAEPVARAARRRLLAELLIVLAAFPLPYTISAIVDLVSAAEGNGSGQRTPVLIKGHAALSFPFEVLLVLLPLAAAWLAWYLLSSPGSFGSPASPLSKGEGGLRALGLDRLNLRGDLALLFGVFFACFAIPIDGGGILLHALGVHAVSPSATGAPSYYTVIDVANGITSGIVEEIVVLGFLVRRLEQLGLRDWQVLVIAVAVRGSYHLYYGWGVLPILGWAAMSVILYRHFRRLLPFIIVHVLWDSSLFVAGTLSAHGEGVFFVVEAALLVPLTFVFWLVWRHSIPERDPTLPSGGTL